MDARKAKMDKLIAARNEQMAAKNKQMDELIAQLTAPRGGNSGDVGGEVASVKLNGVPMTVRNKGPEGDKAKRAKAKKEQNKANKKDELRKQLAALEEEMKANKKAALNKQLTAAVCVHRFTQVYTGLHRFLVLRTS